MTELEDQFIDLLKIHDNKTIRKLYTKKVLFEFLDWDKIINCNLIINNILCDDMINIILGTLYENGFIFIHNFEKSIYYYNLSAEKRNSIAQYKLGMMYEYGHGTEKDNDKALYYYKLSAEQNNDYGQYYLGRIYEHGLYQNKNYEKAYYYYQLSANQNNHLAIRSLKVLNMQWKNINRYFINNIERIKELENENIVLKMKIDKLEYKLNKTKNIKKYFLYFIDVDGIVIKFGISKNIVTRLKAHNKHFIKKHKLKDKLDIISIITFNNDTIYKEVEKKIKRYIKFYDKKIKKYNNTELFLRTEYDMFINLIKQYIGTVIADFRIIDNLHIKELSRKSINKICELI